MREAIKVIRKQMLLNTRLLELFEALREALRTDTSGKSVSRAVQQMEPLLSEFAKLEREQQKFLGERQKNNMWEFVQAQPSSVERDVALRLLQQLGDVQQRLRSESEESRLLLARSKEFVDFHMNVLSETQAGTTYGPQDAERERGMRLFDQNV
jgi:flagellar biosynthesis/type III secretory pathway chaperone